MIPYQIINKQVEEIMECDSQTLRYIVAVAALTAMSISAIIVDGDIGNAAFAACAAGIGYLVKDWRMGGGENNAEEVPQHNSSA